MVVLVFVVVRTYCTVWAVRIEIQVARLGYGYKIIDLTAMSWLLLTVGSKYEHFAPPNSELMIHRPLECGQAVEIRIRGDWSIRQRPRKK